MQSALIYIGIQTQRENSYYESELYILKMYLQCQKYTFQSIVYMYKSNTYMIEYGSFTTMAALFIHSRHMYCIHVFKLGVYMYWDQYKLVDVLSITFSNEFSCLYFEKYSLTFVPNGLIGKTCQWFISLLTCMSQQGPLLLTWINFNPSIDK